MQASEILHFPLGDFTTQGGEVITKAFLAYRTFGNPKKPLIVYPTWYSGAIADNEWLISPNHKGLDPEKYFIVIPAMMGNGESVSPSNYKGEGKMPSTTMYDNVKAQHQLVCGHLGYKKIFAVVGWSMGAGQSFQWATSYPKLVQRIVPFCGAARTAHHNITFLRALVLTLQLDPAFKGGNYKPTEQPQAGKRAFAAIYSIMGFSQSFYREELFKTMGFETREEFLTGFWDEVFAHKDANNLLHLLDTWIRADITTTPNRPFTHAGSTRSSASAYEAALASITCKTLVMPCQTDLYFPPEDSEYEVKHIGSKARLAVIPSIAGHFAGFLYSVEDVEDVKWIDEKIAEFFVEA